MHLSHSARNVVLSFLSIFVFVINHVRTGLARPLSLGVTRQTTVACVAILVETTQYVVATLK